MALTTSPKGTLILGSLVGDPELGTYTGVTTGTSVPINATGFDELVFTLESIGTTSGGTIIIEEATRAMYTGTWSQIASLAASSFTGGAQLATHIGPARFHWVRVRTSATITGGGSILAFLGQQGS